ncbi:MAG: TetR/AcrR family transcriptional regulator [Hyphomicrobiaceae bacterium]
MQTNREKILAVAVEEFADKGYAGANISGIAERCGVAKALVFHHFSSKEALYVAALERIYEVLRQRQNETELRDLDPVEGMRRLVIDTFRIFRERPEIVALLNEENLHRGQHVRGSKLVPSLYNPLIDAIERLLEQGHKKGIFRRDVDPVALYIALSGLGYFYCSNRHTLGAVFQVELFEPARIERYEAMIADMIIAYLLLERL